MIFYFFFFNDTATTEIYTLSLHDALPIWWTLRVEIKVATDKKSAKKLHDRLISQSAGDRKSTRLNSSHSQISYAVFCLKKKKSEASPSLLCKRAQSYSKADQYPADEGVQP